MPAVTRAQAPPSVARRVSGTVVRAQRTGGRPLGNHWVTLHRVGTDHAGPVDSIRTSAAGTFAFRYTPSGDSGALYFVSSRYAGIAYFTPPLTSAVVDHGAADLVLYDTTSAPLPIQVRGRHIVVMAPDSTRQRPVVEAYELSNDSPMTRVAGDGDRSTFDALLPEGARDLHATNGDVSADAVKFSEGRVRLFAPLGPGVKQLSFTYRLAPNRKPVSLPSAGATEVLEVLLAEAQGTVSGAGLVETAPAALNGRRFRRFLAQNVAAGSVISISTPAAARAISTNAALIVTATGAALLLVLARSLARRNPAAARSRLAASDDPEVLARALAALDSSFANLDAPTAAQRADHYEARARLTARRVAALALRDRVS